MFLLNLTWLQFVAVFGGVSAGVVALYLWDRSKRRVTVATLRFWRPAEHAAQVKHRKRIQQPLSLLLQLASIALLLLALAQPRLGSPGPSSRNHVLILDTSAWMAARSGGRTLMEDASRAALTYARSLPAGDRLMLVRADTLATPATAFERNRAVLEDAIAASRPGVTALNLKQAVEFARQAQKLEGGLAGEVVYAGPGRTSEPPEFAGARAAIDRVLPVDDIANNYGLRRMSVRRSAASAGSWEILVSVRNYSSAPRSVPIALTFAGLPVGSRSVTIPATSEVNVPFEYRTRAAGVLEAGLATTDGFPGDDRASVELPPERQLDVVVYSDDPGPIRPVLAATPLVNAVFRKTSEYRAGVAADVILFDRFNPPAPPSADAIWIEPPAAGSPVPVRATVSNAALASWRPDHPLASGLRAKDLKLDSTEVFAPTPAEAVVARIDAGPVIVARAGKPKAVVLGFHPGRGPLRYELTTPLLFANVMRWMAPDLFRRWELNAGTPGTVSMELAPEEAAGVRVIADRDTELPYTLDGQTLRFFAASPGTIRVMAGDRELVYSVTLPELADARWTPPQSARRGVPPAEPGSGAYIEIWPWLAVAGALGLLFEWLLFGRARSMSRGPRLAWRSAR